jgi:urease subunit alpha
MSAEGPLHDLGAISIVNSDSQGMGRIGETIRRTWQLAHAMKAWRASDLGVGWPGAAPVRRLRARPAASLVDDGLGPDDNERVLTYLAKHTVEPAIVHGVAGEVGSLTPGHMADVVLWEPTRFGVRPAVVIKGGVVAWGAIGEGNASVHGSEPTRYGPDWGATGEAAASLSTTFLSGAAIDRGVAERIGTRRRIAAVHGTRGLIRPDLIANTAVPDVEVSPDDGRVTLGGRALECEPVGEVPLSRRYLLA